MITIYHNPRCRKSREGLKVLEESGKKFRIVKYLDTPLSETELKQILDKAGIKPMELVRTKEQIWKEQFKGKELSDSEIISAMVQYPKLLERPLVVNGDRAVLGRPAEKILEIL